MKKRRNYLFTVESELDEKGKKYFTPVVGKIMTQQRNIFRLSLFSQHLKVTEVLSVTRILVTSISFMSRAVVTSITHIKHCQSTCITIRWMIKLASNRHFVKGRYSVDYENKGRTSESWLKKNTCLIYCAYSMSLPNRVWASKRTVFWFDKKC